MVALITSTWADDILDAVPSVTVEELIKADSSWGGTPLPPYGSGTPEISVVRVTLQPGAALPMHVHPQATAGVLLQGRLEVRTPTGESRIISPGDAVIELVNEAHGGASIGDEPAVILVVYAGIKGQPVTRLLAE
jgi:quercetin dioxygenase-like cupin family protein